MSQVFFGDKSRFAIKIARSADDNGLSREVDVWAAGRWLTCDDNRVNVTGFVMVLESTIDWLLEERHPDRLCRPYPALSVAENYRRLRVDMEAAEGGDYSRYRFMNWGPTADNVNMLLFEENGTAYLPFAFWREDHHDPTELGQVFVAELPVRELAWVLHGAAWRLMWDWAQRPR